MTIDLRADLYEACQQISPTHSDYAALPVRDGFDWSSSLSGCDFDRLYLIVFRSVRRKSADLQLLREHDDRAYEEALNSGGLLRECLSFCLWEDREQARKAAGASSHKTAASITEQMYESYVLDRYWLKKVVTAREERLIFEPIQV